MEANGVDVSAHKSKRFSADKAAGGIILTMTGRHKERIIKNHPELTEMTFTLNEYAFGRDEDVLDPFSDQITFERCARSIDSAVKAALDRAMKETIPKKEPDGSLDSF